LPITVNNVEILPKNGVLNLRSFPLLNNLPWVKILPDLEPKVNTECWKFPTPQDGIASYVVPKLLVEPNPDSKNIESESSEGPSEIIETLLEKDH
jgi:hypothetical protein